MKYEVIIFDADETLFDFKKTEEAAFKAMIEEFEIQKENSFEIYKVINEAIWKEFENNQITQEKLKVERFRRFLEKIQSGLSPQRVAASYNSHLAEGSYLYPEAEEVVKSLYNKYQLLMLTNGLKSVQEKRIRGSVIAKYFKAILISEEAGYAKPDPRIFEAVLKAIGYSDKNKVLMTGDSLSSDIMGGVNFGIDTCWYNPSKKVNTTDLKPVYEIRSLHELLEIL